MMNEEKKKCLRKSNALEILKWIRNNEMDWDKIIDKDSWGMTPEDFIRILNNLIQNNHYELVIVLLSRHELSWQRHFAVIDRIFLDIVIEQGESTFDKVVNKMIIEMERYLET